MFLSKQTARKSVNSHFVPTSDTDSSQEEPERKRQTASKNVFTHAERPFASTIPKPKGEKFEVRRMSGRGIGIVAKCDIRVGTLILAESPILELSTASWNRNPKGEIENLDSDSLSQLGRLCRRVSPREDELGMHPTPLEESISKVNVNAFKLNYGSELAVFEQISRFNHSCLPNAFHSYRLLLRPKRQRQSGFMSIRARQHIEAGEEITIDYLESVDWPDAKTRRNTLRNSWGFKCACRLCANESLVGSSNHTRRNQLLIFHNRILPTLHDLDFVIRLREVKEYVSLAEMECGGANPAVEGDLCLVLDPRLCQAYEWLATAYECLDLDEEALKWWEKAQDTSRLLHGPDDPTCSAELERAYKRVRSQELFKKRFCIEV